jgi:hypothetical protein
MQCRIFRGRILLSVICGLLLVGCGDGPSARKNSSSATYSPTPPHAQEVGAHLTPPIVYTIDARSEDVWLYFDFSRNAVVAVQDPKTDDWDLAFRRYIIKANGGVTNPAAQGALFNLGEHDFAAVTRVPEQAVFVSDIHPKNRLHAYNPVVEKWFNYSYLSNVLAPKPVVYIVRTQDGKYAKMRLISYYCTGNVSGCMTFEYVYQGDGSGNLASPAA